jgi:HAD superfamily hydrolase (TIGR01509 family)
MYRMDLEAVTIDAHGTLIALADPVEALRSALAAQGVERTAGEVRSAFLAEVAYYVPRSHEGCDEGTLASLRNDCVRVFLDAAAADLDALSFAEPFLAALIFEPLPGAIAACRALGAAGLRLGVVSNWDVGLHGQLSKLGIAELVDTIVTSAEAGAPKPAPKPFELALERLGVDARRTVHVGDASADREGALAAGLSFEPAPLADAVRRILG